jgi:hypothetical protein
MLKKPACVYINWAAYDELSDNVELTEALALEQFEHVLRLRGLGVQLDYYLMDAFWYARDGGYRTWRKPHWPRGPARWLGLCHRHGVRPGMWFSTNNFFAAAQIIPAPQWRAAMNASNIAACMFDGPFWPAFLRVLDAWYARGIRCYKFDFTELEAATPAVARTVLPGRIWEKNKAALIAGLGAFRRRHRDALLLGYNGLDEPFRVAGQWCNLLTGTGFPLHKVMDTALLRAFDALYCGDPRPADVPAMSFWRAKDIYSDHMVRVFHANGLPLAHIDNSGFMIGTTGTCYYRKTAAWRGMLLLSLMRGGWVNTYYGNLNLLTDADARWFAQAQALILPLQAAAHWAPFGGWPGACEAYGMAAITRAGAVYAVVNPAQTMATLTLPRVMAGGVTVLFHDAGFAPTVRGARVTLGPEQMALLATGACATAANDLGVEDDVHIPCASAPLPVQITHTDARRVELRVTPPATGDVRIVMRQYDAHGIPVRSTGGAPPRGATLATIIRIRARQAGRTVPVVVNYDKAIWSGLSWGVGEVRQTTLRGRAPLSVHCSTTDLRVARVQVDVFNVRHGAR